MLRRPGAGSAEEVQLPVIRAVIEPALSGLPLNDPGRGDRRHVFEATAFDQLPVARDHAAPERQQPEAGGVALATKHDRSIRHARRRKRLWVRVDSDVY